MPPIAFILYMKRTFTATLPELEERTQKLKCETIFNVSRIAPQSTYDSLSDNLSAHASKPGSKDIRVGASSKVNFSKLTPLEQKQRYENQSEEIVRLRAKLKKFSKMRRKEPGTYVQRALDRLKDIRHGLPDQSCLLENVVSAIVAGSLRPNTLPFCQIATILRDVLDLPCPQARYAVQLPEKTIPISTTEYEAYRKIPCTQRVFRSLFGREQRKVEDPNDLFDVVRETYSKSYKPQQDSNLNFTNIDQ